jgi:hypothetical protein
MVHGGIKQLHVKVYALRFGIRSDSPKAFNLNPAVGKACRQDKAQAS